MSTAVASEKPALHPERAAALRQATSALHQQVDAAVMALRPFDSRTRYARFLAMQYRFHQLTTAFFHDTALNDWFPGLAGRERLGAIEQDCRDLGLDPANWREAPLAAPRSDADRASAIGWLYVNEGSNLGAAFLYKHAQALGLDAECGARHLAPHPEGRARHWHAFVAQLNAAPLAPAHESEVMDGACRAFNDIIQLARAMAAASGLPD